MGKNYVDKKLLEKVQERWERAKKSDYATSAFWKSEKDKLSKLTGKKAKSGELLRGVSQLSKTQAELLNRELNIIANSKIGSKYGYDNARRKQRESLVRNGVFSSTKEALKFQKIMGSEAFQSAMDSIEYLSYLNAKQFAQDESVTVKKIDEAWQIVKDKEYKNENERGQAFLDILKKL